MIGVWAELQCASGPVGLWIGQSIVWLHNHLPSFLPEWAKWILLSLPVFFLSASYVFVSIRTKASDTSITLRDGQSEFGENTSVMVRLRPSFTRILISIDSFLLIAIVFGYFQQGYIDGKWWTMGYICSFSIPLVVVPLLVWFIWVPRVLEYSETHIRIVTIFRQTLQPWKRLKSYGAGSGIVFVLRFKGELQGYQIMSKAYSDSDWDRFTDYLETCFPNRER
jgi:hypothetical protein